MKDKMKINEIIHQPEGRMLEFKQELPTVADLCKSIVAVARMESPCLKHSQNNV